MGQWRQFALNWLPDGSQLLPKAVLYNHKRGLVAFDWGQLHWKCTRNLCYMSWEISSIVVPTPLDQWGRTHTHTHTYIYIYILHSDINMIPMQLSITTLYWWFHNLVMQLMIDNMHFDIFLDLTIYSQHTLIPFMMIIITISAVRMNIGLAGSQRNHGREW